MTIGRGAIPPTNERLVLRSNFNIELQHAADCVVVAVSGELDLSTAPQLDAELSRALQAGRDLVVDLERVEFMDCTGLSVLVGSAAEAALRSTRLSVTAGPPLVQKLFAISGIGRLLPVVPPVLEADCAAA